MKAKILEGCTACGLCEAICPEVFEIDDLATVKPNANVDAHITLAKEAEEQCPIGVISIEE